MVLTHNFLHRDQAELPSAPGTRAARTLFMAQPTPCYANDSGWWVKPVGNQWNNQNGLVWYSTTQTLGVQLHIQLLNHSPVQEVGNGW